MTKARAIRVTYLDAQGRAITKAESQKQMAELEELIRLANTPRNTATHAEKAPPTVLPFLLFWFLSKEKQATFLGDMNEEYPETLAKFGKKKADDQYRAQVILSLLPCARQMVMRLLHPYDGNDYPKGRNLP